MRASVFSGANRLNAAILPSLTAAVPFQPQMVQPPPRLVDTAGIDPGRESDRSGAGFSPLR